VPQSVCLVRPIIGLMAYSFEARMIKKDLFGNYHF